MAIRRPDLVWMRGPVPAGEMHDSTMFRGGRKNDAQLDKSALYFKLPEGKNQVIYLVIDLIPYLGKKAIADSAYDGIDKVTISRGGHSKELKQWLGRAKNRQESLHSRLKSFNILGHRFCHGRKGTQDKLNLHQTCVEAVSVLVQYDMECGSPIFDV